MKTRSTDSSDSNVTKRLQIEFGDPDLRRLLTAKRLAGDKTNTDVVRKAVRFYGWALGKGNEGYTLQLVRDGHTVEVAVF